MAVPKKTKRTATKGAPAPRQAASDSARRVARAQSKPTDAAAIRTYLSRLTPATRGALEKLRATIRAAAPGAVEAFSYGIPAFRLDGRILIWCAGWKSHLSLYPISDQFARQHGIDLSAYKTSRGTVQFPLNAPTPLALVKRLVKARIAAVRAAAAR